MSGSVCGCGCVGVGKRSVRVHSRECSGFYGSVLSAIRMIRTVEASSVTAKLVTDSLFHLEAEFVIFEKLLYKNNLQHKKFVHFGKLMQVKKEITFIRSLQLREAFQPTTEPRKGNHTVANPLYGIWCITRVLQESSDTLLAAGSSLVNYLLSTHFTHLILTSLSIIARIYTLEKALLREFTSLYATLYKSGKDGLKEKLPQFKSIENHIGSLPTQIQFDL